MKTGRWRQWAAKLAQHSAGVMPGARSPWAEAMRRELDYICDDPAALRWALGCVLASYRTRLAYWSSFSFRITWRYAATSGLLMLLIGLALQDHAGGQTQPPRPALDATACDPLGVLPENHPGLRCCTADVRRNVDAPDRREFHQPSAGTQSIVPRSDCADPLTPQISDTVRGR